MIFKCYFIKMYICYHITELGDVPSAPRHVSAAELHSPSVETMDRKYRDAEASRRREQMVCNFCSYNFSVQSV